MPTLVSHRWLMGYRAQMKWFGCRMTACAIGGTNDSASARLVRPWVCGKPPTKVNPVVCRHVVSVNCDV